MSRRWRKPAVLVLGSLVFFTVASLPVQAGSPQVNCVDLFLGGLVSQLENLLRADEGTEAFWDNGEEVSNFWDDGEETHSFWDNGEEVSNVWSNGEETGAFWDNGEETGT